jgi:acetyl esterase
VTADPLPVEGDPVPPDVAPESGQILTRMRELGLADLPAETVADLRALSRAEASLIAAGREVGSVEDVLVDRGGKSGREMCMRIYRPPGQVERAILWIHGGGWVLGDLESADSACRSLCLDTSAVVASVDYRLAPENPFPAGLEDCFQALCWLDREVAADAEPVPLVVGGDSAGGNLAAALCLLSRQRSGPSIDHQLLLYPVTDRDFDTASYRAFADGYGLTRDLMRRFWGHYLPGSEPEPEGGLISVLRAADLRDLPPATIVIAGCDVLRDEGEAYALRLRVAGVPVALLRYAGQIHGFWTYSAVSDISRAVNDDIRGSLAATSLGLLARLGRRNGVKGTASGDQFGS